MYCYITVVTIDTMSAAFGFPAVPQSAETRVATLSNFSQKCYYVNMAIRKSQREQISLRYILRYNDSVNSEQYR